LASYQNIVINPSSTLGRSENRWFAIQSVAAIQIAECEKLHDARYALVARSAAIGDILGLVRFPPKLTVKADIKWDEVVKFAGIKLE
jgi:hypothetical protein